MNTETLVSKSKHWIYVQKIFPRIWMLSKKTGINFSKH